MHSAPGAANDTESTGSDRERKHLMQRKILAIVTALVVLGALAIVPAMASAVVLTHAGTRVLSTQDTATPPKITGLGDEHGLFVGSNGTTVTCNDYWMTGDLHRNTGLPGTIVEGTIEKATFHNETGGVTEDCSSSPFPNLPVKVTIPALTNEPGGTGHWCVYGNSELGDEVELKGLNCTGVGNGIITFILKFTGGPTCKYKREASIKATFVTNVTPATLKVVGEPEFVLHGSEGLGCPASGKITKMAFRLYTDKATESESTSNPLTLS
jgi:hypothetical protein